MEANVSVSITLEAKDRNGDDASIVITGKKDAVEITINSKFRTVTVNSEQISRAIGATVAIRDSGERCMAHGDERREI